MNQPEQLRRGQVAYQRRQRALAIARVGVYQRWLAAGSDLKTIPAIPSDRDYRVTRAAGRQVRQ